MKHEEILNQLVADAESDANTLGFLLFGSMANSTHHKDSDIDVITILKTNRPASGVKNTFIDGIKVGNIFLTYEVLIHSIETVPYLLHPLGNAKLLFDREGSIEPLLDRIQSYFAEHQEIEAEWNGYYEQLREEKAEFGYEQTTIVDVWNELELRHSNGKTKRRFFNAFYLSNPRIFSVVKKFL
jgi:predicted nucleotidyltransferase